MISSVHKISRILDCFTEDEPVLGNLEIAEKLNMNASSVHHLVRTLCSLGILIQDSKKKYRLGWKLLEWSNHVMHQQDIYSEAIPLLENLLKNYNGTVHIGMFDAGNVRFVLKVSSKNSIPVPTFVGAKRPAYCTSTGKILLSYNPKYIKPTIERGLTAYTTNTITCIDTLQKELAAIKENGYSISNNENDLGLFGIAAPIQTYAGHTFAALNMVGPVSYMMSQDIGRMVQDVMKTAKLVSNQLGYINT
ncbi:MULTISPECIES: IclR family transcriptional regulator [Gottfriedia]|uniref:IclR family transcriptional regulator n=1 Tax=Gottfriedia solisilvae TaxID=1516104 RepID=A0A8J3EXE7_9BACI|nr:IclR family transcriptional regulator [Gottfriedia solisilvae]GGI12037.1 IclR family transcriptional regulator [Gottfriedia solisilvae]